MSIKLNAICLIKNEGDIIGQTLTFATQYCDRIYVIDNGSTDDTWKIVQSLARDQDKIVPFEQTLLPYSNGLRARVYDSVHHELSDDDWWLILDGDEFLAEDPYPVIQQADRENADAIWTWQIQFYYTDVDYHAWLEGLERPDRSIFERRRYYQINWQELRLFRNQPPHEWTAGGWNPDKLKRACSRRILNRHYQFRDPEQIEQRLQLRLKTIEGFSHIKSAGSVDWRSVMRESRKLNFHREGEPWRFSLAGVLYYYRKTALSALQGKYRGAMRRIRSSFGAAHE